MIKRTALILALCVLMLSLFTGCTEQLGLSISGNSEITYKIKDDVAIVKEAPNLSTITEITIPDEYEGYPVKEIADFSVVNLENVAVINIGKNVETIGEWAFTNNQKLTEFSVDEENEYFCDVDGVLFTKDMKTLIAYPPAKGLETTTLKDENGKEYSAEVMEYVIPDTVETIRTKAFYKCTKITSLTIGSNVKSIEEKALFRCSSLKELVLPDTLQFIGKDAFAYCSSVTETVIPASVTQIDDYAFYNCVLLTKIAVENEESNITLGKLWYPTRNGQEIDVEIIWNEYLKCPEDN